MLGQFGVQTTSIIAVLGAAGLAIGLALQGTLSNGGYVMFILRPFETGHWIEQMAFLARLKKLVCLPPILIPLIIFIFPCPIQRYGQRPSSIMPNIVCDVWIYRLVSAMTVILMSLKKR